MCVILSACLSESITVIVHITGSAKQVQTQHTQCDIIRDKKSGDDTARQLKLLTYSHHLLIVSRHKKQHIMLLHINMCLVINFTNDLSSIFE